MRYLIALAISLVLGCASASTQPATLDTAVQIPVKVENYVDERVTVYTTPDGMIIHRLGECAAYTVCILVMSERASEHALTKGVLELGFRHTHDPGRGVTHYVSTPAFRNMQGNLVISRLDRNLVPGYQRQAK